jgi:photosystem II stability/assembly factor-like uncharacterized protein
MLAFVCTRDKRVVVVERRDGAWTSDSALEGVGAQAVATDGERVLVGARGDGLHLSPDRGRTWRRIELPVPDVFSVAISGADGALYAGTEPSRLFVSRGDDSWVELEALQEIPSRPRWSFPPRPWTHHVRWIAPDPHTPERLLVAIELGGLMYSDDGGASFTDHRPGAKRDAHAVAWHPEREGWAYQAAGDGAAVSRDGGVAWDAADRGRDLPYCWGLALDPENPERWYVSASAGPGAAHAGATARGRLYRWDDTWRPLVLPTESMPYALATRDRELIVGAADGQILHSIDAGESWTTIAQGVGSILAMAVA